MKSTTFLTLEPTWSSWDPDRLSGFRVVKATKKRPSTPGVVIELQLDVPDAAFLPLRPVAAVAIDVPDLQVNVTVQPPEPMEPPE